MTTGTGGGTAQPDFVRRLAAGDDSEEDPVSSPRVVMRTYFWSPAYKAPDADELMAEVLLTAVGDTAYPGEVTASPNWPGVAPGRSGVNNAFSGRWCDASAFADLDVKPPVLWLRGDQDQVISGVDRLNALHLAIDIVRRVATRTAPRSRAGGGREAGRPPRRPP